MKLCVVIAWFKLCFNVQPQKFHRYTSGAAVAAAILYLHTKHKVLVFRGFRRSHKSSIEFCFKTIFNLRDADTVIIIFGLSGVV